MNKISDDFIHMLKSINLLCENCDDCTKCPYNVKRKWFGSEICFFLQQHEGRTPSEWNVGELNKP